MLKLSRLAYEQPFKLGLMYFLHRFSISAALSIQNMFHKAYIRCLDCVTLRGVTV